MAYATPDQYANWLGLDTPPAGAERTLERASTVVDGALLTAVYDVDTAGLPTDPEVRATLADATCAQAEAWRSGGSDHTGASAQWQSISAGKISLTRGYQGGGAAAAVSGDALAPHAELILRRAGLLHTVPYLAG